MAAVLLLLLALAGAVHAAEDATSYLAKQAVAPDYHVQDIWSKHKHLERFAEINGAARDTFTYLPKQYLKEYTNPCWKVEDDFKCLPYFQILGVSKCGTTDMYNRLTEHPDMVDCGWKGPHFWDEAVYPTRPAKPGRYDGSFPAYVGVFDKPAARIKLNTKAITGEASSNTYTAVFSHLRGRTLPKRINSTLAEYLWEATPWARYLVMFRDPVSRYRSAYFYYRNKNLPKPSDRDFLQAVKEDIETWEDCLRDNPKLFCLKQYTPQQLVKGMYSEFLPAWLAVWPRDRFLFMRSEDYKVAPIEHLKAAIKFLGMRDLTTDELAKMVALEAKNTQSSKYSDANPSKDLKEAYDLLQKFYRPYNQALSKAFGGDKRWQWGY